MISKRHPWHSHSHSHSLLSPLVSLMPLSIQISHPTQNFHSTSNSTFPDHTKHFSSNNDNQIHNRTRSCTHWLLSTNTLCAKNPRTRIEDHFHHQSLPIITTNSKSNTSRTNHNNSQERKKIAIKILN